MGKESRQVQSESPLGIGDPEEILIRYHKVVETLLDAMQNGLQTLFRQATAAG